MEIIRSKSNGDIEKKILEALEPLEDYEKELQSQHAAFDQYWKDYRDLKDRMSYPIEGGASFSNNITSTISDAIIPRITEDIFDFEHPVQLKAASRTEIQTRDQMQKFFAWDLETKLDFRKEINDWITNSVIYGVSFLKSFFNEEKEVYATEEPRLAYIIDGKPQMDGEGNIIQVSNEMSAIFQMRRIPFEIAEIIEKKKRWKHYQPEVQNLDVKSVIWPDDATSIKDSWENGGLFIKTHRTRDFLFRMMKGNKNFFYKNLDKALIMSLKEGLAHDDDKQEIINKHTKTKKIPLYEAYLNVDIDGDDLEEKIVCLYNRQAKVIIGWEKYNYEHNKCPIIPGYIRRLPGKIVGVGIPEMLYDRKGVLDELDNNEINRHRMYENPITLVRKNGVGFNKAEHKFRFGAVWRLDDISENAISFLKPPKNESETDKLRQDQYAMAQKRSGITDYALGAESEIASNSTATGIQALIQEGSILVRHMTRNIAISLTEVMQQRIDLYWEKWGKADDPEVKEWLKEILDVDGNPLEFNQTMAGLRQKFNVYVAANKLDKRTELIKAESLYNILMAHPLLQNNPQKQREVTINYLRWMGVRDAEDWLPTEEETQALLVAAQKEAMAQVLQEQQMAAEQAAQEQAMHEKIGQDKLLDGIAQDVARSEVT